MARRVVCVRLTGPCSLLVLNEIINKNLTWRLVKKIKKKKKNLIQLNILNTFCGGCARALAAALLPGSG